MSWKLQICSNLFKHSNFELNLNEISLIPSLASENESGLNPNASSDSKYRVAENEPMKVSSGKFRGAIQAALNMAKEEIVETLLKVLISPVA